MNKRANEVYTLSGKQFNAVGDICFFNLGAPVTLFYSKSLAGDYKLDNLYELVDTGKWALDNERTADVVEKMIEFMSSDATRNVNKIANNYGNVWSEYVIPKLSGTEVLFFSNQMLVALDMRASESDFDILPTPKYDKAQESYHSFLNAWWNDQPVIPSIDRSVIGKSIRDDESARMVEPIYDSAVYARSMMSTNCANCRLSVRSSNGDGNLGGVWSSLDKT